MFLFLVNGESDLVLLRLLSALYDYSLIQHHRPHLERTSLYFPQGAAPKKFCVATASRSATVGVASTFRMMLLLIVCLFLHRAVISAKGPAANDVGWVQIGPVGGRCA